MKQNFEEVDSSLRTLAFESTLVEELESLCRHEHWGIRWKVARNPNCPKSILEYLSEDNNEHVLLAVINNNNISDEEAMIIFKSNEKKLMKLINQCSNIRKIKFLISSSDNSKDKSTYKEIIFNYILEKYSRATKSVRSM